jgi:hypothetical protein
VVCRVMARGEPRLLGLKHSLDIRRGGWLTDCRVSISNCASWTLVEALTLPPGISPADVAATDS